MIFKYIPSSNYSERTYLVLAIAFSISYALVLAELPIDKFIDRDNYLNYTSFSLLMLEHHLSSGFFTLLQNEPVWLLINIFLGFVAGEVTALKIIIFSSSLVFSFSIIRIGKADPKFLIFAIFICLFPQVLKNYIIHLRQGVAIALCMYALTSNSVLGRRIGILIAPFIHSSYFFLLQNFVLTWYLKKKKSYSKKRAFWIFLIITSALAILLVLFLGVSEARQSELYKEGIEPRTGLAFLFWLIILVIFLVDGSTFRERNFFSIAALVSYLMLYFFFDPIARIFESALPLVLVAGYQLSKYKRRLFLIMFAVLFIYQWLAPVVAGAEVFRLA